MHDNKITVIDAPCGQGKTTWAIQKMRAHRDTSYIYCTPLLSEIKRIRTDTRYDLSIEDDDDDEENKRFKQPTNKNNDGTKIAGFNRLLAYNRDVAVSHTTFLNATDETIELIRNGGYTLIIDEALDVVTKFNDVQSVEHAVCQVIKKGDMDFLLDKNLIHIEQDGRVIWRGGEYEDYKYSEVARFAKLNRLYCAEGKLLLVVFPPELFKAFEKVYVLTYMFGGSIMKYYFDLFGIEYEVKSVCDNKGRKELVDYDKSIDTAFRTHCKGLIHICNDRRKNAYLKNALSAGWYERATSKDFEKLQNDIRNYFRSFKRNKPQASKGDIMWTTFAEYENKLKGKGYTVQRQLTAEEKEYPEDRLKKLTTSLNCFVPCNARATNDFKGRWALAYCVNMFINPMIEKFFKKNGVAVDNNLYALSAMIQWIFRSRIRDGEDIYIYVPNVRMRELLTQWLNDEI